MREWVAEILVLMDFFPGKRTPRKIRGAQLSPREIEVSDTAIR